MQYFADVRLHVLYDSSLCLVTSPAFHRRHNSKELEEGISNVQRKYIILVLYGETGS